MAPTQKLVEKEEEPPKVSFAIPIPLKQIFVPSRPSSSVKGPNGEDNPPCFFVDFGPNGGSNQQAYIPVGTAQQGLRAPVVPAAHPVATTTPATGAHANSTSSMTLIEECPPSVMFVGGTAFILFLVGAAIGILHHSVGRRSRALKLMLKEQRYRLANKTHSQPEAVSDSEGCMGVSTDEEEVDAPQLPGMLHMSSRFDGGHPPLPRMLFLSTKHPSSRCQSDLEFIEANIPGDPVERARYFENNYRNITASVLIKIEECLEQTTPAEMQAWYEWYEEQERVRKRFPGTCFQYDPYCPTHGPTLYYAQPPKYEEVEFQEEQDDVKATSEEEQETTDELPLVPQAAPKIPDSDEDMLTY